MIYSVNRYFIIGLILFAGYKSPGQFSSQEWHEGILVTANGDTLNGKIKYDLEANLVQLDRRGNLKVYSSHKVFYFEIFDEIYRNYRQFYTIPYQYKSSYKTPIIFELLYEGRLSLLSREKITKEVVNNQFWTGSSLRQDVLNYDFFFLNKKGKMYRYLGTKSDLYKIMSDKQGDVRKFIKTNRLRADQMQDLIRITSFYNSI